MILADALQNSGIPHGSAAQFVEVAPFGQEDVTLPEKVLGEIRPQYANGLHLAGVHITVLDIRYAKVRDLHGCRTAWL